MFKVIDLRTLVGDVLVMERVSEIGCFANFFAIFKVPQCLQHTPLGKSSKMAQSWQKNEGEPCSTCIQNPLHKATSKTQLLKIQSITIEEMYIYL